MVVLLLFCFVLVVVVLLLFCFCYYLTFMIYQIFLRGIICNTLKIICCALCFTIGEDNGSPLRNAAVQIGEVHLIFIT